MKRVFLRSLLGLTCVAAVCAIASAQDEYEFREGKWVRVAPPAAGTVEGELELIRQMVKSGSYRSAVSACDKFLKDRPEVPEREEVLMLGGMAELGRDRYYQAFEWFKRQWDEYPSGQYSERALQKEYEIAEAFLAGKRKIVAAIFYFPARDEGLEILAKIPEQAPNSLIAEQAMFRIGEDHAAHSEYTESAQAFDRFLEMFPKSTRARDAMLKAARMTYASYHPGKDLAPLLDAQQRFRTFREYYPRSANEAGVPDLIKQIDSQRAQEEVRTAELYERTGQPRAAVFYYRRVADTYPSTAWATMATAAMQRLGNQAPPALPAAKLDTRPLVALDPASQPATMPAVATTKPVDHEPVDLDKMLPTTQPTTGEGKAHE